MLRLWSLTAHDEQERSEYLGDCREVEAVGEALDTDEKEANFSVFFSYTLPRPFFLFYF